jgi:hypothetical protein
MANTLTSQALAGGEARLRENRAQLIRFIEQLDCASCQGELAIDDDFQPKPGFIRFFEGDSDPSDKFCPRPSPTRRSIVRTDTRGRSNQLSTDDSCFVG